MCNLLGSSVHFASHAQQCIHAFTYKFRTETLSLSRKTCLALFPVLFHGVCVVLSVLSYIIWGYWGGRSCWWPELQSGANGILGTRVFVVIPIGTGEFSPI